MSTYINYEPPHKKMKYNDDMYVQFKIGYMTKIGNVLLENKKIQDEEYPEDNDDNILVLDEFNRPLEMYFLHFQSVEGCEIYLIADKSQIDITNNYTIKYIFDNFINNMYLVGAVHYYYKNNYKNGIISDISALDDEPNNELILHYTHNKDTHNNVAWRTIKWDLFSEFVPM